MQTHKDPTRRQAKTSEAELKRKNRGHEATNEIEAEDEEEDNDKVGDKKRLRVSRACDQCRRRKDKCDGRQPICQPCSNIKRVCTYNMFTKKRGLPTGYVRSIEILLGLVFRHVEGSEALVSMLLDTNSNVTDPKALSLLTVEDKPRTESLAEHWRKSMIAKQIELLLPTAESLEDEDAFSQRLNEKLTLAWSLVAAQKTTPSEPPKTLNGNSAPADNALNPLLILPTTGTMLDLCPLRLHGSNALKLPSNWLQLLDLYFSNTHSWFPICQKQDLLRPAYMLDSTKYEGTDTLASGERAFLWAVIAYALHQCSRFGIELCNQSSYKQCSSEEVISAAKGLIALDSQSFEHGHVRALLVLGLLEMSRGYWTPAWVLIGQALYIAVDLGVIVSASHGPPDNHNVSEGQKRLSRGCFILDTLISACVGRRPYLKRSDLQSNGVLQVDGIEEWEAWQPSDLWEADVRDVKFRHSSPGRILSTSNQFVKLIALLNDLIILSDVPLHNKISMVSQSLGAWRQQLPPHCQVFTPAEAQNNAQKSPQLQNLCLTYIFVSSLLRAKAGRITPTTQEDRSPAWDGSMDQPFRIITEQTENYGHLWMPLNLCKCFCHSLAGSNWGQALVARLIIKQIKSKANSSNSSKSPRKPKVYPTGHKRHHI